MSENTPHPLENRILEKIEIIEKLVNLGNSIATRVPTIWPVGNTQRHVGYFVKRQSVSQNFQNFQNFWFPECHPYSSSSDARR